MTQGFPQNYRSN